VVIVASLAFGARAFVENLTPYVGFKDARAARGSVQVMGKLDKSTIKYASTLDFVLVDDSGDRLPVSFSAVRPANFEQAMQVTAIGQYDGNIFQAKNLLVKCPTKYQGTETKEYAADGKTAAPERTDRLRGAESLLRKEPTRQPAPNGTSE